VSRRWRAKANEARCSGRAPRVAVFQGKMTVTEHFTVRYKPTLYVTETGMELPFQFSFGQNTRVVRRLPGRDSISFVVEPRPDGEKSTKLTIYRGNLARQRTIGEARGRARGHKVRKGDVHRPGTLSSCGQWLPSSSLAIFFIPQGCFLR